MTVCVFCSVLVSVFVFGSVRFGSDTLFNIVKRTFLTWFGVLFTACFYVVKRVFGFVGWL